MNDIRTVQGELPEGWPYKLEESVLSRSSFELNLSAVPLLSDLARTICYLDSPATTPSSARPPSEIAAFHLWQRLDTGPLQTDDIIHLARLLGGVPLIRNRPIATTPYASGHVLEFLAPKHIPSRFDGLLAKLTDTKPILHPILHAIGVYMDTLRIHPLPDGNGRLARLLFQGSLKQTLGLKAPIYPLGPACAANRPLLMNAYLAWDFDHNPQPLVDFVVAAIDALNRLYLRGKAAGDDETASPGA